MSATVASVFNSPKKRADVFGVVLGSMALVAVLSIAACGGSDRRDSEQATANNDSAGLSGLATRLVQTSDYEPAGSPIELARQSDVVLQGTVDGFAAGRSYAYPDDEGTVTSVVMQMSVGETFEGRLPEGSDGHVFIELYGASNPGEWEGLLPADLEALLYLTNLPPATDANPGAKVLEDGAGRPAGQPLFGFTNPQGMLVDEPEADAVLQPVAGVRFPGTSLDDFEPEAAKFPTQSEPAPLGSGGAA